MSVIMELSIFPVGSGESLSPYVARAVKIIEQSGLQYSLGAMGTSFEGEWPQVMDVVNKCFEDLSRDSDRVYMIAKADYRKGQERRMEKKVSSVKQSI